MSDLDPKAEVVINKYLFRWLFGTTAFLALMIGALEYLVFTSTKELATSVAENASRNAVRNEIQDYIDSTRKILLKLNEDAAAQARAVGKAEEAADSAKRKTEKVIEQSDAVLRDARSLKGNLSDEKLRAFVEAVRRLANEPDRIAGELARDQKFKAAAIEALSSVLSPVPPGTIIAYGGPANSNASGDAKTNPPPGWLLCNGDPLRIPEKSGEDYYDLYRAIGTSWGGDDKNFRLPDLRGIFLRGVDHGRGMDPGAKKRGDFAGSNQPDATAMPKSAFTTQSIPHRHTWPGEGYETSPGRGGGASLNGHWQMAYHNRALVAGGEHAHKVLGGDAETRPKNAYVNWIIKY